MNHCLYSTVPAPSDMPTKVSVVSGEQWNLIISYGWSIHTLRSLYERLLKKTLQHSGCMRVIPLEWNNVRKQRNRKKVDEMIAAEIPLFTFSNKCLCRRTKCRCYVRWSLGLLFFYLLRRAEKFTSELSWATSNKDTYMNYAKVVVGKWCTELT